MIFMQNQIVLSFFFDPAEFAMSEDDRLPLHSFS